jgi:acyl-CoA reductase-like NAD-dependent aldehyde dehydrogenase
MIETKLFIGGQDVAASSGATFDRKDPVTGEVASRAAAATVADARAAVEAAQAAFPAWASTGPSQRRILLLKAAEIMEAKAGEFAKLMMEETGAPAHTAARNVKLGAAAVREAASLTSQITGEVLPSDKPGTLSMGVRQPAGVSLGIAPWNAPVVLGARSIASPLACGNTVIMKGSEICPATHRLIVDVMVEAGLPAGVVNYITNAPADAAQVVEALIAHPYVRRVNFTGSSHVGRIIGERAAHYLKPALLELGGKAPFLVLDDADLDLAAGAAAFGAFSNAGQICMSTERVLVDDSVGDAFVAKFAARAKNIVVDDPRNPKAHLGSMIGVDAVERVMGLVDEAVSQGATLVTGGRMQGPFMAPTIVDHVTPKMRIYYEETFGPVAAVSRVNGVEEAVAAANDNVFGLSSAVFGKDAARALTVAQRIQSGICHVNGATLNNEAHAPFGGVKDSGYGSFGSKADIAQFTDLRWITISTQPEHYPF